MRGWPSRANRRVLKTWEHAAVKEKEEAKQAAEFAALMAPPREPPLEVGTAVQFWASVAGVWLPAEVRRYDAGLELYELGFASREDRVRRPVTSLRSAPAPPRRPGVAASPDEEMDDLHDDITHLMERMQQTAGRIGQSGALVDKLADMQTHGVAAGLDMNGHPPSGYFSAEDVEVLYSTHNTSAWVPAIVRVYHAASGRDLGLCELSVAAPRDEVRAARNEYARDVAPPTAELEGEEARFQNVNILISGTALLEQQIEQITGRVKDFADACGACSREVPVPSVPLIERLQMPAKVHEEPAPRTAAPPLPLEVTNAVIRPVSAVSNTAIRPFSATGGFRRPSSSTGSRPPMRPASATRMPAKQQHGRRGFLRAAWHGPSGLGQVLPQEDICGNKEEPLKLTKEARMHELMGLPSEYRQSCPSLLY